MAGATECDGVRHRAVDDGLLGGRRATGAGSVQCWWLRSMMASDWRAASAAGGGDDGAGGDRLTDLWGGGSLLQTWPGEAGTPGGDEGWNSGQMQDGLGIGGLARPARHWPLRVLFGSTKPHLGWPSEG